MSSRYPDDFDGGDSARADRFGKRVQRLINQGVLHTNSNEQLALEIEGFSYGDRFPWADQEAIETAMAITRTFQTMAKAMNRHLAAESDGLGRGHHNFLTVLYLAEGSRLPLSELARTLNVTPTYVTKLLDALVARGLVERVESPDDRRITFAHLTADGQSRCDTLVPAFLRFLEAVGNGVSAPERRRLHRLLDKVRLTAESLAK